MIEEDDDESWLGHLVLIGVCCLQSTAFLVAWLRKDIELDERGGRTKIDHGDL